jgi:hypothetical protein
MGKKTVTPVVIPVATSTATSTQPVVLSTTSTIAVDWTKLGKDRLYTEEEGKYENLSAEEKEVVRQIAEIWTNGKGDESNTRQSLLFSLHNGFALLFYVVEKPSLQFVLFDAENNTIVTQHVPGDVYPYKLSSTTLVFVEEKQISYYKPGFSKFKVVQGSQLNTWQSYTFTADMGLPYTNVSTTSNSIAVSIYPQGVVWQQSGYPKPIGLKTFHIE